MKILPYHTYGKHKYENIGQKYMLEDVEEPTHEQVEAARVIFEKYFKKVWTQ